MKLTFIETKFFTKKLFDIWNDTYYHDLQDILLERPGLGVIISGGGGLRKIRWKAFGSGKSGGVRVIYYWIVQKDVILLLDIFSKNEKENLSRAELSELVKIKNEAVKDYE